MTSSSDVRCGVYQIWLSPTHFYIGRSSNIPRRVRVHLRHLSRGVHENPYMQNVYNQYGFFSYDILFPCAVESTQSTEQMYLSTWMKTGGCMNLNPSARSGPGMTGKRHSEETKARIREARSRQIFSEETRQKWSASRKGNQNGRGHHKPHSTGTRQKISEALKGKAASPSRQAALSRLVESKKGKPLSEAHRESLSAGQRDHWEKVRRGEITRGEK